MLFDSVIDTCHSIFIYYNLDLYHLQQFCFLFFSSILSFYFCLPDKYILILKSFVIKVCTVKCDFF